MKINIKHAVACITLFVTSIAASAQTNLISNGSFQNNTGCNTTNCQFGDIENNCLNNWETDHGTPHVFSEICGNTYENFYVRCAAVRSRGPGGSSIGEGFFQRIDFVPGQTYRLCVWLSSLSARLTSTVWISLGNSSPGVPFAPDCFSNPAPSRLDIFNAPLLNYAGDWFVEDIMFTVPDNSNFDRIIFWHENQGTSTSYSLFDNISLFTECKDNWVITQPGFQIDVGNHQYADFIRIESSNPSGQYITNNIFGNVNLLAGHKILIKPGAVFSTTGSEVASFSIKECESILNQEEFCFGHPCFGYSFGNSGQDRSSDSEQPEIFAGNIDSKTRTVNIFPNPNSNDVLNINSNIDLDEVYIYDNFGRVVLHHQNDQKYLNISSLKKGQYLLEAIDIYGNKSIHKLIKM